MSIPTALLSIAMLSCLMSLGVLGSLLRAQIPGIRRWFFAGGLDIVTCALVLSGKSGATIIVSTSFLLTAALLALQGFRQFFYRPPVMALECVVLAAVVVLLVYWTVGAPHVNARDAVVSAFLAYVRVMIAWTVQRYRPAGRPKYAYRFVASVALVGGAVHAVRFVIYGFGLVHETTFLQPTPLNVAFLGVATLTLPCLSVGMVMLAHDRLAQRMERLATIDDLTGALGRRAFVARAEALFDQARGDRSALSIAVLDIDYFKSINDRFGHAAGDEALAHVAATIAREIRKTDVLGRIGGEEFALLLPDTAKDEARRLTDRLREVVAAAVWQAPSGDVACTFSAGVDEFGADDTLRSVMARADTALYAAKANGRNCVMAAPSVPLRQDFPAPVNLLAPS